MTRVRETIAAGCVLVAIAGCAAINGELAEEGYRKASDRCVKNNATAPAIRQCFADVDRVWLGARPADAGAE